METKMPKVVKILVILSVLVIGAVIAFFVFVLAGPGYRFSQRPISSPRDLAVYTQAVETARAKLTEMSNQQFTELTKVAEPRKDGTPLPTAAITSANWLDTLLTSPTCAFPCWENIKPGETSLDDAIRIVSSIPGAKITGLDLEANGSGALKYVSFSLGEDATGIVRSGFYSEGKRHEFVSSVELFLGDEQSLTLEQFIRSYGEPDAIIFAQYSGGEVSLSLNASFALFYKKFGMILYADTADTTKHMGNTISFEGSGKNSSDRVNLET